MYCTSCGSEQADSPTFCRVCGVNMAASPVKKLEPHGVHRGVQCHVNARIVAPGAAVRSEASEQSPVVADLVAGDEVGLGEATKKQGKQWVQVNLRDGRRGYISGDTKIYAYQKASLLDKEVTAYEQPSSIATPSHHYRKGAEFQIVDSVKVNNADWVKIRDNSGNEGFIDGKTRIKTLTPDKDKGDGRGDMLWGAIWCIGGIAVTVATYAAAGPDGTFIVAWGAIIFGAIQFFRGLFRYMGRETQPASMN